MSGDRHHLLTTEVLRKATHPDPNRRYDELSEFVHDLRRPTEDWAFWRGVSLILAGIVVFLLLR